MVQKSNTQADLVDAMVVRSENLNARLDRIDALIDWSVFNNLLKKMYASTTGRPSFSALLLFKAVLLQAWYNLSDYGLEEALDDRLSFRRFIGLSVGEKAPDHSTICRFREQLGRLKLTERLFALLEAQMQKKNLIVKKGTLVDATFVEAAVKKPDQKEDGSAGESEHDPDAKWTSKGRKKYFGYKGHVGVDLETGIIRKAKLTPANVYDGFEFESMLSKDEEWAFADKAYDSKDSNAILEKHGINNGVLFCPRAFNPLTNEQKRCNKILSGLRGGVERAFGTLKRSYGYRRVRYRGLRKNHSWFLIVCMAFNLRKMDKLCLQ